METQERLQRKIKKEEVEEKKKKLKEERELKNQERARIKGEKIKLKNEKKEKKLIEKENLHNPNNLKRKLKSAINTESNKKKYVEKHGFKF